MQSNENRPLLFQRVLNWLVCKYQEYRVPFLSTLIFGFLAHTFAFTNKLVNHDEVQSLFSKGGTVVVGRWGLGALDSIFPNISMPWIYGVITIFLLAVSVCILVCVLKIRDKWMQVLAAGFVITFPSLTGTFSYMFTSNSYAVAFLMAVLSVWLIQHKSVWYWLSALICLVFSLSIYQAYITITASVLVLILIRQLLEDADAPSVFRRGVAYVVFLVLALGIYYVSTQLILKLMHLSFSGYATRSLTVKPSELLDNARLAYEYFFLNFREGSMGLIPTQFSRTLHLLLLICAAVLLILRILRMRKNVFSLLLLAGLVGIFPLSVNCIYLFISRWSIHTLVAYGFVCTYLLILVLADGALTQPAAMKLAELCRRASLNAMAILSAVIIMINIYVANGSHLALYLRYENAYAFYTSLIADMKMSPDFTEGTRLAVIGIWEDPDFYSENLDFTNFITGTKGIKPDSYSKERFMQYYLGFTIPFASEEEQAQIAASPEYAEMPVYPYYGSMRKFGDILVVKLSEEA